MICLISFSKYSNVLPAFICASAIGNLCSVCLGLNVLKFEWLEILTTQAERCDIFGIRFLQIVLYLALDANGE